MKNSQQSSPPRSWPHAPDPDRAKRRGEFLLHPSLRASAGPRSSWDRLRRLTRANRYLLETTGCGVAVPRVSTATDGWTCFLRERDDAGGSRRRRRSLRCATCIGTGTTARSRTSPRSAGVEAERLGTGRLRRPITTTTATTICSSRPGGRTASTGTADDGTLRDVTSPCGPDHDETR